MSLPLSKAVRDVESILKKSKQKSKSLWEQLSDQISNEGTWDENLLASIKSEIKKYLDKYKYDQLFSAWENTEFSAEYSGDVESIGVNKVKEDLSEEILDRVLESVDSSFEEETIYAKDDEDDEEDEFFNPKDDEFGPDDIFEDEERF